MARGFIGRRVGVAVTYGYGAPAGSGGVFSAADNYYLNSLSPDLNTPFSATGGTKDTSSRPGFAIHTFTGSGAFTVSSGSNAGIEYMVIGGGGGGGGGGHGSGGGGAGGFLVGAPGPIGPAAGGPTGSNAGVQSWGPGTYTVTIGAGIAGSRPGAITTSPQRTGGNSSIVHPAPISIIANGGGGGGNISNGGGPGGSGGGGGQGAESPTDAGPGTATQGYPGGFDSQPSVEAGSGGGGAGQVGEDAQPGPHATGYGEAGDGGNGVACSITGSSVTRCGGGGGGCHPGHTTIAPGGSGGGGNGAKDDTAATNGTSDTGSGGGGAQTAEQTGGNGAGGIVVIAYPTS